VFTVVTLCLGAAVRRMSTDTARGTSDQTRVTWADVVDGLGLRWLEGPNEGIVGG
jgi:hypothetical protein